MDAELIKQLNRGYVRPADAGPAWRAAHDAGVDMSLIEDALSLTPEQQLAQRQQVLNFLNNLTEARLAEGTE